MRYRPLTLLIGLSLTLLVAFSISTTALSDAPAPTTYWHTANAGLVTLDVEALTATVISPTILYAGAWGEGVYRSTDDGATWQPANTGITLPLHIQGGLAANTGITR